MSRRERFHSVKPEAPEPKGLTPQQREAFVKLLRAADEKMSKGENVGLTKDQVKAIVGETAKELHARYRKKFRDL